MSHSCKLIEPKEGSLEPPIYSQLVRSTGDKLGLQLVSEVSMSGQGVGGQSCGTEHLTCGI